MKKNILFAVFSLFTVWECNAQFINSIAITAGGSLGNEKFRFLDPLVVSKKKYGLGPNASIFAEFFSGEYVRWVSELQYNEKGSVDKSSGGPYRNKLQYGCWNNYLKFRYEMYNIIPYVLIGPRLEYDITQATASPAITGKFLPLHVSAAAGAGLEFVSYGRLKFFTEAFYNPDIIMPAYLHSGLDVRNKNIELRVGLKFQFGGRKETCNTPTYVE